MKKFMLLLFKSGSERAEFCDELPDMGFTKDTLSRIYDAAQLYQYVTNADGLGEYVCICTIGNKEVWPRYLVIGRECETGNQYVIFHDNYTDAENTRMTSECAVGDYAALYEQNEDFVYEFMYS